MTLYEQFAKAVRRGRFDNDEMTQIELARRVGVSRQTINNVEKGGHTSLAIALKIAQVLGISLDSLVTA